MHIIFLISTYFSFSKPLRLYIAQFPFVLIIGLCVLISDWELSIEAIEMKMLISVPHFTVSMEGSHGTCSFWREWFVLSPDGTPQYLQVYGLRGVN